jgi:hypothetical protein
MVADSWSQTRALEHDWTILVQARDTRRTLSGWAQTEPMLAGFTDLEQLRHAAHDRAAPARGDAILYALARLAATDGGDDVLAARVVLQLLLPGATRLIRRVTAMYGDADEAEAAVLAELTVGIRTYPWRRRRQRVAANLLLDCHQRLLREQRRNRGQMPAGLDLDLTTEAPTGAEPTAQERTEIIDLFLWAHREGILNEAEALLVAANRVDEIPIADLATRLGVKARRLFEVRADAEQRLRAALHRTRLAA